MLLEHKTIFSINIRVKSGHHFILPTLYKQILTSNPETIHAFLNFHTYLMEHVHLFVCTALTNGAGHFCFQKNIKNVANTCNPRFMALLPRVPCTCVLQITASVMPEGSDLPTLALKRNAKSPVSPLLHTFPKEIQHFCTCFFDPLLSFSVSRT